MTNKASVSELEPQLISQEIINEKYLKEGEDGAEAVFKRVAKAVASVEKTPELQEKWEKAFYQNMKKGGIGAGRIMSSAGTGLKATWVNCFVQCVGDAIEGFDDEGKPGIYEALKQAAVTMKAGGGVGYNFSFIRPKNAKVKTLGSYASGPCSYMDVFDMSCKTLESAGCFAAGTLIATDKGLIDVKDIVTHPRWDNEELFAITHKGPRKITAKFNNGIKPVYRVTTEFGYSVTVTEDHKFAVIEEGKIVTIPLKELVQKNFMEVKLLALIPQQEPLSATWTPGQKQAYLAGAFQGNGTWRNLKEDGRKGGIAISNGTSKKHVHDRCVGFLKDLGFNAIESKRPKENTLEIHCFDVEKCTAWEQDGINKGTDEMRIPQFVLEGTKEEMAAYLAGLFEADGFISETKSNIRLRMASKPLLEQVQVVLGYLGVPAKIWLDREAKGNWSEIWGVGVFGKTAQTAFNQAVGLFMLKPLVNVAARDQVGYGHDWDDVQGFGYQKKAFAKFWSGDTSKGQNVSMAALRAGAAETDELTNTMRVRLLSVEALGEQPVYDLEVDEVHLLSGSVIFTSNSRRGAQMGALNINHPDVEEFIVAKRTPGRWNNFNVSVGVKSDFMEAVVNNRDYQLIHKAEPSEKLKEEGAFQRADGMWVYKTVKARDLWDKIMQSAYDFAEPGILFLDNINNDNNLNYCEEIHTTNPCFAGDVRILTPQGYRKFEDCDVNPPTSVHTIADGKTQTLPLSFIGETKRGTIPIVNVITENGICIRCTPDHKFQTDNGLVEAKDLKGKKVLRAPALPEEDHCKFDKEKFLFSGEEFAYHFVSDLHAAEETYPKFKHVFDGLKWQIKKEYGSLFNHPYKGGLSQEQYDLIYALPRSEKLYFLWKVFQLNSFELSDCKSEGSRGHLCYFADAYQAEMVCLLLNEVGIYSIVRCNPNNVPYVHVPEDQEKLYQILICENIDVVCYAEQKDRTFIEVVEVEDAGVVDAVYCATQPDYSRLSVKNLVVSNCGEQPLPDYGCCDLGPIILTKFVKNPFGFGGEPEFDFDGFKQVVRSQVRFLDNVLDGTYWPLEQQDQAAKDKRRIGVGFTGLGNALCMLKLKYDSDEGRAWAKNMAETMRNTAYEASVELAKEKGAFPLFDADKYLAEGTFASRLPDSIKDKIRKHGIRNSHLLSIAPTGTVSLAFADNASNGIEPPFSWGYQRNKRQQDGSKISYQVEDHAYRLYRHLGGDVSNLPDYFQSALEMSTEGHVKMMEVIQPFIDTAISKTVNIPADYPFEDFKLLYERAWRAKLKGCATYRPNDILGAVLEVTPKEGEKKEEPSKAAPVDLSKVQIESRPSGSLDAVSHKIEYWTHEGKRTIYLIVSFMEVQDGERKVQRAVEFFTPINQSGESQHWITATMRSLSLAARGGYLDKALSDLRKVAWDKGSIKYGWITKADGGKAPLWHDSEVALIAYAIQQVIEKKTQPELDLEQEQPQEEANPQGFTTKMAGKKCPECGAHALIKKDGCQQCTECGYLGSCG